MSEGRTFLVALNRNLTDSTALAGSLPANLRSAADAYSQGEIDAFLLNYYTSAQTDTLLNDKAAKGANSDITSLSGLATPLSVGQGGTGVASITASRALVSDGGGKVSVSAATSTEVGYLSGVTSAIQTQINAKAPIDSPTFTGTVGGITKSMVGLGNVSNLAPADLGISTATQAALDLKLDESRIGSILFVDDYAGATDSDKLTAAFAAVRAAMAASSIPVILKAAPRAYSITTSVDATAIRNGPWTFDCEGAVFTGSCAGKPMIDMVHSRYQNVLGGTFIGDTGSPPSCAILYGRNSGLGAADNQTFVCVKTDGYFSKASMWNIGAETDTHIHPQYWNTKTDGSSIYLDGCMAFGATSDYQTLPASSTSYSCIQHTFIGSDIRGAAGGTVPIIKQKNAHQIHFYGGYGACANEYAVEIISFDAPGSVAGDAILDLHYDIHLETSSLDYPFKFTKGDLNDMVIRGFYHKEMGQHATEGIYLIDTALNSVQIVDYECHIQDFLSTPTNGFCYPSGKLKIIGKMNIAEGIDLANLLRFDGEIFVAAESTIANHCVGSYSIFEGSGTVGTRKGAFRASGTDASTYSAAAFAAAPTGYLENGKLTSTAATPVAGSGGDIDTQWTAWTPAITSSGGTSPTLTVNSRSSYIRRGKKLDFLLDFDVDTVSGSGVLFVPMPVATQASFSGLAHGVDITFSELPVMGTIASNTMSLKMFNQATGKYSDYPVTNVAQRFIIQGSARIA